MGGGQKNVHHPWPLALSTFSVRGRERVAGVAAKRTFTVPGPWPLSFHGRFLTFRSLHRFSQLQQRQQQRGISSRMPTRSQKLGHVHEVVQSADAECGVAPLCPDAWRSIEGYVRPHAVTAAPPCYLSARDCWAAVLPFACGHSLPASRTVLRPLRPMTVRARVPLHA